MKTLIIISIMALGSLLYAATDYQCVSDCTAKGYQYAYCQSQCEYEDSYNTYQAPKKVDYQCVSDCTAKGYLYNYCQDVCSY